MRPLGTGDVVCISSEPKHDQALEKSSQLLSTICLYSSFLGRYINKQHASINAKLNFCIPAFPCFYSIKIVDLMTGKRGIAKWGMKGEQKVFLYDSGNQG